VVVEILIAEHDPEDALGQQVLEWVIDARLLAVVSKA
jgi:hypothetical protein